MSFISILLVSKFNIFLKGVENLGGMGGLFFLKNKS